MWERNLQDLIRGLRAHKNDEARFIAEAIEEIRKEVRGEDMELKAAAVLKLTYLEMLGYDMGWASFHVVEVMASARFHLKSMGYLAATQSFEQDTDVLMLTTNLLKKDLTSSKPMEVAVAMNGLSHIVTPDLGRDLSRDLVAMLTHSRAAIRKRAVLALYKVFRKYPEALDYGMDRLKERMDDPDPGVVCAVLNVLCELARQNPEPYLPFAPPLFHILTTANNNWMLIKILKLFALLTPHEPRLVKKLQPPITQLIQTTPAISLLYECVLTCIIGGMLQGPSGHSLARTCVSKLADFLEDTDQNLKYIALLALTKIVPSHPHLVAEYESKILSSIGDSDISIRMRALDLVSAMVNANNLQSIIQQLLSHLVNPDPSSSSMTATQSLLAISNATSAPVIPPASPARTSTSYRTILANRILSLCSMDLYANVSDFEWFVSVLFDLAYVARAPVGSIIRDQLIDIAVRVKQVRRYTTQISLRILSDDAFVYGSVSDGEGSGCQEVLYAAAWICGEYANELSDPRKAIAILSAIDSTKTASDIVAVCIQSIAKIFGTWAVDLANRWDDDELAGVKDMVDTITHGLQKFAADPDFEVQERATNFLQLFSFVKADVTSYKPRPKTDFVNGFADASTSAFDPVPTAEPQFPKSLYLMQPLFSSYALNPVAVEAQARVPVPDGLDLNAWIVPRAKPVVADLAGTKIKKKKDRKGKNISELAGDESGKIKKSGKKKKKVKDEVIAEQEDNEAEERALAKARRQEILRDDPYYLIEDRPRPRPESVDIDSIPVVRLDDLPPLNSGQGSPARLSNLPILSRPASSSHLSFSIDRGGEMPPNAIKRPESSTSSAPEHKPSRASTPGPARNGSPAIPPSPFHAYEADDLANSSNPEPITVSRVKKKKTGKKKSAKDTV